MSGYLLDTHIAVWAALVPDRLGDNVARILHETANVLFISSVSIAEMTIKSGLGKLALPDTPIALGGELGALPLALTWEHAERLSSLPMLHRDPFDRLLIAQAMVEKLTLVTADAQILQYPDVELLGPDGDRFTPVSGQGSPPEQPGGRRRR